MEAAADDVEETKEEQAGRQSDQEGRRGEAFKDASLVKVEQTYITPTETHNPIETSGTIAALGRRRKADRLRRDAIRERRAEFAARTHGLETENVRVICPFVGGAFGCKGAVWPHVLLAAVAAKAAGVPVKFHIPRKAMFTGTGHRTPTRQSMTLAANRDGKLQAMRARERNAHFHVWRLRGVMRRAFHRR